MKSQASPRLYKKEALTAEAESPALVAAALQEQSGDTPVTFAPGILSAEIWLMILTFLGWREAAESDPTRRAWRGIALLSPAGSELALRVRKRMPLQLGQIFYAAESFINVHYLPRFYPEMERWFMRLLFEKAGYNLPRHEYQYQLDGDDERNLVEHEREYILAMPRKVCYKDEWFDLRLHLAQRQQKIDNKWVLNDVSYAIVVNQWARLWAAFSDGRRIMFREALWEIIDDFERSEMEAAALAPSNQGSR